MSQNIDESRPILCSLTPAARAYFTEGPCEADRLPPEEAMRNMSTQSSRFHPCMLCRSRRTHRHRRARLVGVGRSASRRPDRSRCGPSALSRPPGADEVCDRRVSLGRTRLRTRARGPRVGRGQPLNRPSRPPGSTSLIWRDWASTRARQPTSGLGTQSTRSRGPSRKRAARAWRGRSR